MCSRKTSKTSADDDNLSHLDKRVDRFCMVDFITRIIYGRTGSTHVISKPEHVAELGRITVMYNTRHSNRNPSFLPGLYCVSVFACYDFNTWCADHVIGLHLECRIFDDESPNVVTKSVCT